MLSFAPFFVLVLVLVLVSVRAPESGAAACATGWNTLAPGENFGDSDTRPSAGNGEEGTNTGEGWNTAV